MVEVVDLIPGWRRQYPAFRVGEGSAEASGVGTYGMHPRGSLGTCATKVTGLLTGQSRTTSRDEGRSLETALQEEVSNHRLRLQPKAGVVSVTEKAELDSVR